MHAADRPGVTRRQALCVAATAAAACADAQAQPAAEHPRWRAAVRTYIATLARPDGGYAWGDQPASHLTPTFAAIGCLRELGYELPHKERLAEFVRTHHPAAWKKLEQEHREFEFQQMQSLAWLGQDLESFREQVLSWQAPVPYLNQYERHGYPVFRFQLAAFTCRALLGIEPREAPQAFVEYLVSRRRDNGSFNNTPASDGSDGNVLNTWWGLEALHWLGRQDERKGATIAWLRACQLNSGGFTHAPHAEIGRVDDIAYTWAAVNSLDMLGASPADRDGCLRHLRSMWNADGGFGDRPGWASNAVATYRAVQTLHRINALQDFEAPEANTPPAQAPSVSSKAKLPGNLQVFSIQIEAHGRGSPAEAVDLARALKIHLWGAKNARPEWLARAQQLADVQNAGVKFFTANEEYGTWVDVPGMGTYSHTSDIIAPAGAEIGPSLASDEAATWPEFRQRRLAPLERGNGRLLWQFGENEELVRLLLDDSLARGGFAAISTFHFGNPDFTNTEPFLKRYHGHLPYIALQDAHGNEPWWFADMTTGFRTLFLAAEPTWDAWLQALRAGWVVAVRHDAVTGFETRMHGGSAEVVQFVRDNARQWQWWDNPAIARPLLSLVAVRAGDEFEAGRPNKGVTLRVRCAWTNTTQGLAKQPLAEFVRLSVDGREVKADLYERRRTRSGPREDRYHHFAIPEPAAGMHTATATVRELASGKETSSTITFEA